MLSPVFGFKLTTNINKNTIQYNHMSSINITDSLECLAVVDDSYHILDIELRKLSVPQVLLFVNDKLFSVSKHINTQINMRDKTFDQPSTQQRASSCSTWLTGYIQQAKF